MQKLENFLKVGKRAHQAFDNKCSPIQENSLEYSGQESTSDSDSDMSSMKSFKDKSTGLLNSIWENIVESY